MKERYGFNFEKIKETLEGSIVESVEKNGEEGLAINVRPFNVKNKHSGATLKFEYFHLQGGTELIVENKK